jgi:hypothetical protein
MRPLSGLKLDSPVLRVQNFGTEHSLYYYWICSLYLIILLDEIKTNHNQRFNLQFHKTVLNNIYKICNSLQCSFTDLLVESSLSLCFRVNSATCFGHAGPSSGVYIVYMYIRQSSNAAGCSNTIFAVKK